MAQIARERLRLAALGPVLLHVLWLVLLHHLDAHLSQRDVSPSERHAKNSAQLHPALFWRAWLDFLRADLRSASARVGQRGSHAALVRLVGAFWCCRHARDLHLVPES